MHAVYGKIFLISSLFFSAIFSYALLLKEPMVWPDEAAFASVAREMASGERILRVFEYPPLPFYLTAGVFKIFGFSITNQRLLSLGAAALFLVPFFFLTRMTVKNKFFTYLVLSFMILDFTFLKGAKAGRPEIFLLTSGTAMLWLLLKLFEEKARGGKELLYSVLGGLLGGVSFLTHPVAVVFLSSVVFIYLIYLKTRIFTSRGFYFFAATLAVLPALAFRFNILDLSTSAAARLAVGSMQQTWLVTVFQTQTWELKLAYIGYLTITLLFILLSLFKRDRIYFALSGLLLLSWAAALYGRMFWYYLLPLPFIYLSGGIMLSEAFARWKRGFVYLLLIIVPVAALNLALNFKVWNLMGGEKYSYELFTNNALTVIPPGQTIFLSTIPDLYYGLKTSRPADTVYEFASSVIPRDDYLKRLDEAGYIVYNGSYDEAFFGDLLVRYIELNKERISQIGGPHQFNAFVIKLKTQQSRQHP